jgi:hypothetical protein
MHHLRVSLRRSLCLFVGDSPLRNVSAAPVQQSKAQVPRLRESAGRAPQLPLGRVWLTAFLIFAACVCALEVGWRSWGFRPEISDARELWHFWRQRVYTVDRKKVVLLGTSRMQADVAVDVLERQLGMPVVQLGVPGQKSPIGLLQDLAEDEQFDGIVLCSLYIPLLERSRWADCSSYRRWQPSGRLSYCESIFSLRLRSSLAILSPQLTLASLTGGISELCRSGHCFDPPLFRLQFDRSLEICRQPVAGGGDREGEEGAIGQFRGVYVPRFDKLAGEIDEVNRLVKRLRNRGGDVVFLHLPSSGNHDADEESAFSKAEYWDRFAARTTAHCLHFKDCDLLRGFSCPDGIHLSKADSRRFTEALVLELRRAGIRIGDSATGTPIEPKNAAMIKPAWSDTSG